MRPHLLFAVALLPTMAAGYQFVGPWVLLAGLSDFTLLPVAIIVLDRVVNGPPKAVTRRQVLVLLAGLMALPVSCAVGAKAESLDFKYRRMRQYEALVAALDRQPQQVTSERSRVAIPADVDVDALSVWARRKEDGQLRVGFVWSSGGYAGHRVYVYCLGDDCVRDRTWLYRRLNERWLEARD